DAMAVQVGAHQLTFNRSQTTDVDVLTTLGDQRFALGLLSSDQRSGVGHVLGKGLLNAVIDEVLEIVLQRQEIGLGVDFDDHGTLVVIGNLDRDRAFSGNVAGFLGS